MRTMEKATFAAGCFWGVEATFREIKGVVSTSVGYTGGWLDNPTYKEVCSGRTEHAEAVEVLFNPSEVSYSELLDVFWNCHDPTQINRQGPDIGTNYRSAIFYHSPEQKAEAIKSKEKWQGSDRFQNRTIASEITEASTFYKAEDYHQQYYEKRGIKKSCHFL